MFFDVEMSKEILLVALGVVYLIGGGIFLFWISEGAWWGLLTWLASTFGIPVIWAIVSLIAHWLGYSK